MENYGSASHKSKEMQKEKHLEPAIKSNAAVAPTKSAGKKFMERLWREDLPAVRDNILIPAAKSLIVDTIIKIVGGGSRPTGNIYTPTQINYGNYYKMDKPYTGSATSPIDGNSIKRGFDYNEIEYPTMGDAQTVLQSLREVVDVYNVVSIQDLYEISNIPCNNYMYSTYGWTADDIYRTASSPMSITRGLNGRYTIRLPRPSKIN